MTEQMSKNLFETARAELRKCGKEEIYKSFKLNLLHGNSSILPNQEGKPVRISGHHLRKLEKDAINNDAYRYANLVAFAEILSDITGYHDINEAIAALNFSENPFFVDPEQQDQKRRLEDIILTRIGLDPSRDCDRAALNAHLSHMPSVALQVINSTRETILEATANDSFFQGTELLDEIKVAGHFDTALRWGLHPRATRKLKEEGRRQFSLYIAGLENAVHRERNINGTVGRILRFFNSHVWDNKQPVGYLTKKVLYVVEECATGKVVSASEDITELEVNPGQEIVCYHNPVRSTHDEQGEIQVRLGARVKDEKSALLKKIYNNGETPDDFNGIVAKVLDADSAERLINKWNSAFKNCGIRFEIIIANGLSNDLTRPFDYAPYSFQESHSEQITIPGLGISTTSNPTRGNGRPELQGDAILSYVDPITSQIHEEHFEFKIQIHQTAAADISDPNVAHTIYKEKRPSRRIAGTKDDGRSLLFSDWMVADTQQTAKNDGHVDEIPLSTVKDDAEKEGTLFQKIKHAKAEQIRKRRKTRVKSNF